MRTSRPFVTIDFETASDCDLKKCGAYVYAAHPTTEILVVGYSVNGGSPVYLLPSQIVIDDYVDAWRPLWNLATDQDVIFVAHNCGFERNIWSRIMVDFFGWPEIPIERWHDTMAVALSKGLPAKLDTLARVLELKEQKDTEGNKFTLSLSKPFKNTKENRKKGVVGAIDRSPAAYIRTGIYVISDVRAEDEVLSRVKGFAGNERAVWELDQRINDRGILVDRKYVRAGINIIERVVPFVVTEFRALVGCNPSQGAKFLEWMKAEGCDIPNLQKATVEKLLADNESDDQNLSDQDVDMPEDIVLPERCRQALQLRAKVNSASVKKLPAMLNVMGDDDRARGLLQYHGAGPGRWAGRLLQPHNFPRSVGFAHDMDDLVSAILAEDIEYLRMVYGDPIIAISGGLRHALIAASPCKFHLGDYTQIEARIVLALAGATRGVQAFLDGKPYADMAEQIYHRPIDKHLDVTEYTIGKCTILGCGFQMGWQTFRKRYCPEATDDFAKAAIKIYREDFAPEVVKLWYALEQAAVNAVWERKTTEAYGVQFKLEGEWLTARLPSGRKLWYFDPRPGRDQRPPLPGQEQSTKPVWSSLCVKNGKTMRRQMYGGLLTENVVQGLARDLLVEAMFRCEAAGAHIVLTVHDEIVLEDAEEYGKVLQQCMTEASPWAKSIGMPINIELTTATRYRK